jgi:hypothetical protein
MVGIVRLAGGTNRYSAAANCLSHADGFGGIMNRGTRKGRIYERGCGLEKGSRAGKTTRDLDAAGSGQNREGAPPPGPSVADAGGYITLGKYLVGMTPAQIEANRSAP